MRLETKVERGPTVDETSLDGDRFSPGTILCDRYRIIGVLGRGGMGEVYRADDLTLRQPVALKFLPEFLEQNVDFQRRLLQEVRLARSISHPNVCRVYDIGDVDGHPFISMEYVDGESFDALLLRIGRLPQDKALDLSRQLVNALAAAHREGILHRDIKPANLMVDRLGRARMMDFGMAVVAEELVKSEILEGTVAYMAPEQATGIELTPQSDLYSLGLVLYEVFTGKPAFDEPWRRRLRPGWNGVPTPPSRWVPELDAHAERVIMRCLALDPRDRPASAEALAEALTEGRKTAIVLKPLVVCELVELGDRSSLPESGNDDDLLGLIEVHDQEARVLLQEHGGQELEAGDDFQILFDRPWDAVRYALAYHQALATLAQERGCNLAGRVGIHLVEMREDLEATLTLSPVEALDREIAVRLGSLAEGGQILLTRDIFDLARQAAVADEGLLWLAHGTYEMEGLARPLEIFEVGFSGRAPLTQPAESEHARRLLAQEIVSGWRPAPGLELPRRAHWVVERKLGEGAFGEVWLLNHDKTRERRVFKFCYEPESLHALQREITVFRLLKEELGERGDIARILDWNFAEAPYFIEAQYTAAGSLPEWAEEQGGLENVPLEVRLEIVAQVATALAAAHSVGVLHKDVKPSNVLVTQDSDGRPRAQLNDFGVGLVTERRRLAQAGITALGMTEETVDSKTPKQVGTRLYMAPELVEGKAATLQADIYALGVVLYQIVMGDFSRALAPGWRRDVEDPLLIEDIALSVDGSRDRRLSNARRLADQLRDLEPRRQALAEQRRSRAEARQMKATVQRWRRRRNLVGVILALSILFGGGMGFLAHRVQREADRSHRVTEATLKVLNFLDGLFQIVNPITAVRPRNSWSESARKRLLAELRRDLVDQPSVRAALLHWLGKTYQSLGDLDIAEHLLQEALNLRREAFGEEHVEVAVSLNAFGGLWTEKGDYKKAEGFLRRALKQRRRLRQTPHIDIAESLNDLGNLLAQKGEHEKAKVVIEEALAMHHQVLGGERPEVAMGLNNLGLVLHRQGYFEPAILHYRQSLEIYHRILGTENMNVGSVLNNLGIALRATGDLEAAEPILQEALDLHRRVFAEDHPNVAMSQHSLALVIRDKGRLDEAYMLALLAEKTYRKVYGNTHAHLAAVLSNQSFLANARGQYEAAESLSREALAICREVYPDGHWVIANVNSILGASLAGQGRHDEAESLLLDSYMVVKEKKTARSPQAREGLRRIIQLYVAWGRPKEAARYRALDTR